MGKKIAGRKGFFLKKTSAGKRWSKVPVNVPPPLAVPTLTSGHFTSIPLKPRSDTSNRTLCSNERDPQRDFNEKQRQQIFSRDDYRCVDCGSKEKLEADHIVAWANGGKTTIQNGQTLCSPCNKKKSDT